MLTTSQEKLNPNTQNILYDFVTFRSLSVFESSEYKGKQNIVQFI